MQLCSRSTTMSIDIMFAVVAFTYTSGIKCVVGDPNCAWDDILWENKTILQWMTSGRVASFVHCLVQHSLTMTIFSSPLPYIKKSTRRRPTNADQMMPIIFQGHQPFHCSWKHCCCWRLEIVCCCFVDGWRLYCVLWSVCRWRCSCCSSHCYDSF